MTTFALNLNRRITSLFAAFLLCTAVALCFSSSASAAVNILFNATDVQVFPGGTKITGTLTNYGNEGATVRQAEVSVDVTDNDGNYVWSDSCQYGSVNVFVPAGGTVVHTFGIRNGNCPGYTGYIRWDVRTHLSWW